MQQQQQQQQMMMILIQARINLKVFYYTEKVNLSVVPVNQHATKK
jgi:hypothetical protein